MKRKQRMISLLCIVAVISVVQEAFGTSEAVSTGNGADSPWLWVSENEGRSAQGEDKNSLLEVVEYIEDPSSVERSLKSEPRFIGHLKRKLCRIGFGIGCGGGGGGGGGGRDKNRQHIEPQDINYVQPLVIQAVGKPIPAIPAGFKKSFNKNNANKKPSKLGVPQTDIFNLGDSTITSSRNTTTFPIPGTSLNTALLSNPFNLMENKNGFPQVFSNPGLGINTSKFGTPYHSFPAPPIFKSPRPNLLGGSDHMLGLGSPIGSDLLAASNSMAMESLLTGHPIDMNAAAALAATADKNILRKISPGVFKGDLVNSLQGLPGFGLSAGVKNPFSSSSFGSFSNLPTSPHQPQLSLNKPQNQHLSHTNFNPGLKVQPLRSNPSSINSNLLHNALRSGNQINPPKIKILNLSTRPKKEAVITTTSSQNSLDENGEKVIKHIHVHKHIHQMDQLDKNAPSGVINSVRDNLDSFSTSVFSSTDNRFQPDNGLKNFISSSHRSKKRQRNMLSNNVINSVRSNIGSCTCMPKHDCPVEFVSEYDREGREDLDFMQDPRRNIRDFSVSSSHLESRAIPDIPDQKIQNQVIKPRKNVIFEGNYSKSLPKERKILLNLKHMKKRDLHPKDKKAHAKAKPKPTAVVSGDGEKKSSQERKIFLNLKKSFNKREALDILSEDVNSHTVSRRQEKYTSCVEDEPSPSSNRVKRSPQFIRVSDDTDRNDNIDNPSSTVDIVGGANQHEDHPQEFIKTFGNFLSNLPPLDVSLDGPSPFPGSPLSFLSFSPTVPGIHSLPGVQHPLSTHPLSTHVHSLHHLPLASTPTSSLLHHPLLAEATEQKYDKILNQIEHSSGIPPLPPLPLGPLSLYLDVSPNSREKVNLKRKRHPIVTDSHERPNHPHYPTRYPSNGRPTPRPTTDPCHYINCKDLSHYCPAQFKRRSRPSRHGKRRLQTDKLPFSCGLHEVCCNLDNFGSSFNPVGSIAAPLSSGSSRSCGRSTVTSIKGRISSGTREKGEAKFGEFPWQAAILKKEGKDSIYVCAGSLIDRSHVLTAAHCVEGYAAEHLRIRLGEWDVNRDTEFYAHLEYDVVGVAVHPDFYSGNLINDIAILRMLYPVDISNTPHVSPICLPRKKISFAGSRCWVSGWGKDAFGKNGKYQNLLKKIDIPVLPRRTCQDILRETRLGPDYSLHPGMMCAGGEPEKDACKGDGGGPLSCRDIDGNFVLSGIVSWGIGCGQPGIPGIYVNVEYFTEWIKKMIDS